MTIDELQAVVRGIVPTIKDLAAKAVEPLVARIDTLESEVARLKGTPDPHSSGGSENAQTIADALRRELL
jgi:uncharacterized small protein (DUF1192 family)